MIGNRARIKQWITYVFLILSSLLFCLPIAVMISGALKPAAELKSNPYSLIPTSFQWSNFSEAIGSMPFATYLSNSLFLGIGCVVGTTLSSAITAYGLSRVQWRGRKLLFALVIATMLLPWHITMIPRFVLLSEIGLYNSLWAIVLPTFLGDAFFIFLLRQFFLGIPEEILEAGRIDGLNHWGLFWKIVVPLSTPALATVALFRFIEAWNDFGGPLLYLNDPEKFPLAYGLDRFVSSYSDQTHLLLAAAVLFSLPIIVLFFFAQKTFIKGISTSGIKG